MEREKWIMKRSGFKVMARLIGLVRPLTGYMILAILMGVIGHLCASFITIFGGYAILQILHPEWSLKLGVLFVTVSLFALLRGFLRYAEQACNHFIAFKLLALIRDKIFGTLRRLCPAKLEGKDKGNLIAIITSDIELLEVFYAHTISPIFIAILFSIVMVSFIGSYHIALGVLALTAYVVVGGIIPLLTSRLSKDAGVRFRTKSGLLSGFVLDSLRGMSETIQYGQGEKRMEDINRQTDHLSEDERHMKQTAGRNAAVTNAIILIFDLGMLFLSATLVGFEGCLITTLALMSSFGPVVAGRNAAVTNAIILIFDLGMLFLSATLVGFEGCLITTLALMSSFGPVVALASLGATLQNTFAAGNRVLDILDESPAVEEITGKEEIAFYEAAAKNVTFSYGEELILDHFSVVIPENKIIGINGRSGSGGKEEIAFYEAAAKNVTFSYGEELILDHFSVVIPENKIIGINGRSGSGGHVKIRLS